MKKETGSRFIHNHEPVSYWNLLFSSLPYHHHLAGGMVADFDDVNARSG